VVQFVTELGEGQIWYKVWHIFEWPLSVNEQAVQLILVCFILFAFLRTFKNKYNVFFLLPDTDSNLETNSRCCAVGLV